MFLKGFLCKEHFVNNLIASELFVSTLIWFLILNHSIERLLIQFKITFK